VWESISLAGLPFLAGPATPTDRGARGRDANLVAAAVLRDTVEDTATLLGELASIFVGYLADGDIGVVVGHWKTRNVAHAGRVAMET
jgi:hypothetical protein